MLQNVTAITKYAKTNKGIIY